MLLSYAANVAASSTLPDHPAALAVNEDMRTWWSARTGAAGEWFRIDLGRRCVVNAVQTNFGDEGGNHTGPLAASYQYLLELSPDAAAWKTGVDRADGAADAPHDYVELGAPMPARYVRITNRFSPAGSKFSLSGLRVFGICPGAPPAAVAHVSAVRDPDPRRAHVAWSAAAAAEFYIVRSGISPEMLTGNFQVYDGTSFTIPSLNAGSQYYVTVDAVGATGLTAGGPAVAVTAAPTPPPTPPIPPSGNVTHNCSFVQQGICLHNAMPILRSFAGIDPAVCCANCTVDPSCVAWNINTEMQICFLRGSYDTNPGPQCISGCVRGPCTPHEPPA